VTPIAGNGHKPPAVVPAPAPTMTAQELPDTAINQQEQPGTVMTTEQPVIKKNLDKYKLKTTPGKSSLTDIKAKIEEQEKEKKEKQETFTLENIKVIWQEYTEYNPTQSVKSALNNCELELDGNKIIVYVPNPVTKNTIMLENMLIEKIRDSFHKSDIEMVFEINPERFPDIDQNLLKNKKTQREILKEFYDTNHGIKDFMDELGLKLEEYGID
jgi:hypothetical protein